jgi:hypothetical protein
VTLSRPRIHLLVLGAVAALALLAAPAARAQVVAVSGPDGLAAEVDLAALAGQEDVAGRSYVVRDDAGGETARAVRGFSLAAVLEHAGVDPVFVGYVEIARGEAAPLLLSRRQATDTAAFPDGPVVVYGDAGGLHLLRPSAGSGDPNGADEVVDPGGRLSVRVRSGRLLKVRIEASAETAGPGERVTFTAVLDREAAGEPLDVSWYFDDGRRGRGREVIHRFRERGAYDVTVGVTAPDDDVGASAVKTIQVGEPLGGPHRKGGGTNEDEDAPDSGAATGASGGGDGDGAAGAGAAPAAAARPRPERRDRAAPPRRRERAPASPPRRRREAEPAGTRVSGELLSSAATLEPVVMPAPPAQAPAARTGRPREARGGLSVPAGVWHAGAIALLLLLGWSADMRRAPRTAA